MSPTPSLASEKSRLAVLLEHFGTIEDPRDVRRILHPLSERWLANFGQVDKWSFCLRAASMPRIRSDHDETSPPDPRTGIQG